jgi:hypothetical protein
MRTLILATASAIALGLAGAGAIDAADYGTTTPAPGAPSATTPTTGTAQSPTTQPGTAAQSGAASQPGTSSMSGNAQFNSPAMAGTEPSNAGSDRITSKEIRQAQEKLRSEGLYRGRSDGLMGPETQQALRRYQHRNGLPETATLDQGTMNSLLGGGGGQGSSMPPSGTNGAAPASGAGTTGNGSWNGGNPSNPAK